MYVHLFFLRFLDYWLTILAPTKHCHPDWHPSLMLLFPQNLPSPIQNPPHLIHFQPWPLEADPHLPVLLTLERPCRLHINHPSTWSVPPPSAHSALLPHFVLICFLCAKLNVWLQVQIAVLTTILYLLFTSQLFPLTLSLTSKPFVSPLLPKKDTIQEIHESFRNRNPVCSPKEIESPPQSCQDGTNHRST